MKCDRCQAQLGPDEKYEHAGQVLCEDCYLEIKASPRVCDPWAVYTAKKEVGGKPTLTPVQEKMVDLIRNRGPLGLNEICRELGITEEEFRTSFAALRHMELARATKVGHEVKYTTF
ncbi:MAG: hypothetical protein JRJ29_07500 [Deltaproteobacteria bacterium]|nr:hypothetical protein [Deltaproteobacteria bacterium]